MDWEAIRAEYVAGTMGQKALARQRGVSFSQLRRRAAAEGWAALRRAARAPGEASPAGAKAASDSEIALRVRRRMLMKLERMAEDMPCEAVTEQKRQDDSAVSMFKLRDLTAAFKELTGDMSLEDGEGEAVRIIVDP